MIIIKFHREQRCKEIESLDQYKLYDKLHKVRVRVKFRYKGKLNATKKRVLKMNTKRE